MLSQTELAHRARTTRQWFLQTDGRMVCEVRFDAVMHMQYAMHHADYDFTG